MTMIQAVRRARSPDPMETLILAVLYRAHMDAQSRTPQIAEPAKRWLAEVQDEVITIRGRHEPRTNDRFFRT